MTPAGPITQTCHHHRDRPASAKCPSCGRLFCRECVTEHADRILCVDCLAASGEESRPRPQRSLSTVAAFLGAFIMVWVGFYLLGVILARIPVEYHDPAPWMERQE